MIRAHHSRGISEMSFLELFVSRKLEMDAQMIRNELESRSSSACI